MTPKELKIVLIRHARSTPDHDLPEADWPLAEDGHASARALAADPALADVTRIVSSPYLRARDTVAPLAARLGLAVEIHDDLRERRLAAGRLEDWRTQLERSWLDLDHALPGGESSRTCQQRVMGVLQALAAEEVGGIVAASSHGNAIALALHAVDGTFGFSDWDRMGNPELFRLRWRSGTFERID